MKNEIDKLWLKIEDYENDITNLNKKIKEVMKEIDAIKKDASELSIKYPAKYIVHWPSGDTPACQIHAEQLKNLGSFMGVNNPAVSALNDDLPCMNCVNEANEK